MNLIDIDAVKVVRCKDCKQTRKLGNILYCEKWYGCVNNEVSTTYFCSYGVRRGENEN